MTKFNKNYLIISSILIATLVILQITSCARITILDSKNKIAEAKLSTIITKDTSLLPILSHEFKEEYYITHLQIIHDQILTFVSILFGIVFFVGFTYFHIVLERIETQLTQKIDTGASNAEINNNKTKHKLLELYFHFSNTILTNAVIHKNTNNFEYLYQTLMGLANLKSYGVEENNINKILPILIGKLKSLNHDIKETQPMDQSSLNLVWTYMSELTTLRDQTIIDELNILRQKIKSL